MSKFSLNIKPICGVHCLNTNEKHVHYHDFEGLGELNIQPTFVDFSLFCGNKRRLI